MELYKQYIMLILMLVLISPIIYGGTCCTSSSSSGCNDSELLNNNYVISCSGYNYLTQNLSLSYSSLNLSASNLTLDCQNHNVTSKMEPIKVDSGFTNVTIQNCVLTGGSTSYECIVENGVNVSYSNITTSTCDDSMISQEVQPSLNLDVTNATYPTNGIIDANESNGNDGDLTYNLYINGSQETSGSNININRDLSVGTYMVTYNTTGGQNYTQNSISKTLEIKENTSSCGISFNESSPLTYPSSFKVSTNCTSSFQMKRNGTTINDGSTQELSAGNYNFTVIRDDNENYTKVRDTKLLNIDKAPVNIDIIFSGNGTNVTNSDYKISSDQTLEVNAKISIGKTSQIKDTLFKLFKNGSSKGNLVGDTITYTSSSLQPGDYYFNSTWYGNQNYSYFTRDPTVTVISASQVNVTLLTSNKTVTQNEFFNVSVNATCIGECNISLDPIKQEQQLTWWEKFLNFIKGITGMVTGNLVSTTEGKTPFYTTNNNPLTISTNQTLTWQVNATGIPDNYTFFAYGNTTSDSSRTKDITITINKSTPKLKLEIKNTTYPNNATINASESNKDDNDLTYNLYIDGSQESNLNVNKDLSTGNHIITFNTSGGQNYTANSVSKNLKISKNTSSCDIYFNETSPLTYPDKFKVFTNCTSSFYMTRNSTPINNGSVQQLSAGTYNFTVQRNDTQNYTNTYDEKLFIINKAPTALNLSADPSWIVYNGTETNVTGGNCPTQISCTLYRNDSSMSNPDTNILSVGTYEYEYNTTGNENYTSASENDTLMVQSKPLPYINLTFDKPSPQVYGANITAYCETNSTGDLGLYRNGKNVTGELNNSVKLGAGTYNYVCNVTETNDYSYNHDRKEYTINKSIPDLDLIGDPSWSVNNGTETNITGINCPTQINCSLYRNSTLVNNSDIQILDIGTYRYEYNTTGNDNHTSDKVEKQLTIEEPTSGGGSGGGAGGDEKEQEENETCIEDWACTSWSECEEGTKIRECYDANACGTEEYKPIETEACQIENKTEQNETMNETMEKNKTEENQTEEETEEKQDDGEKGDDDSTEDDAEEVLGTECEGNKTDCGDFYKEVANKMEETMDDVEVEKNVTYNETTNKTQVEVKVKSNRTLKNFKFYQKIPKCMAMYARAINFSDKDYTVLEEDPLIMWEFEEVKKDIDLSFDVKGKVSEECYELLKELFYEEEPERFSTKEFPISILTLVVLIVIFIIGLKYTPYINKMENSPQKSKERLDKYDKKLEKLKRRL